VLGTGWHASACCCYTSATYRVLWVVAEALDCLNTVWLQKLLQPPQALLFSAPAVYRPSGQAAGCGGAAAHHVNDRLTIDSSCLPQWSIVRNTAHRVRLDE
jgi:hypothetical protein